MRLTLATALAAFFVFAIGGQAAMSALTPGQSWDAAYDAAACGAVIELAAGTHPAQNITGQRTCPAGQYVVFQPATGATVTMSGSLTTNADWVEVRDVNSAGDWNINTANVDHVRLRNVGVDGLFWSSNGTKFIEMLGGEVGPMADYHPQIAPGAGNGAGWITDVLFDGVLFHDMTASSPSVHTECLQVAGGTRFTFRNNVFRNCASSDLQLTQYNGSGSPTAFVIENNFFGTSTQGGYFSFHMNSASGTVNGFVFRHNSSPQEPLFVNGTGRPGSDAIVEGNYMPTPGSWACPFGARYNAWRGAGCSPTDTNVTALNFVNPSNTGLDLHLLPGASALNRGNPASFPVADIDGQARTSPPDAGADEAVTPPPPPPTTAPPPPAEYHPACEPTCDQQIVTQTARGDALVVQLAAMTVERDAALAQRDSAETARARLADKLARIDAIIHEP